MKYYFIHMAAAAGRTVPHLIEPISILFFECMKSYLGNSNTNVGFQMSLVYRFPLTAPPRKLFNVVKSQIFGGQFLLPLWLIKRSSTI